MSSPIDLPDLIATAVEAVPKGAFAVGVSGGADSVALLLRLHARQDLTLHVVHLDHETRSGASADDAEFVRELSKKLTLPCTIQRRSDVESNLPDIKSNTSARFRAARLELFRRVVREHNLDGVILAHHADDQAETVLQRLLRGSGVAGLAGMSTRTSMDGILIVRPFLEVRGESLREMLRARGQSWREDASNASDVYLRNRLRNLLSTRRDLTDSLLRLSDACHRLRDWVHANTPAAGETLRTTEMLELPGPLQRELARRWLANVGVCEERIDPGVVEQLINMSADAATPGRQHFPGELLVRRSKGVLSALLEKESGRAK